MKEEGSELYRNPTVAYGTIIARSYDDQLVLMINALQTAHRSKVRFNTLTESVICVPRSAPIPHVELSELPGSPWNIWSSVTGVVQVCYRRVTGE